MNKKINAKPVPQNRKDTMDDNIRLTTNFLWHEPHRTGLSKLQNKALYQSIFGSWQLGQIIRIHNAQQTDAFYAHPAEPTCWRSVL